jgi:hypothetical protein
VEGKVGIAAKAELKEQRQGCIRKQIYSTILDFG